MKRKLVVTSMLAAAALGINSSAIAQNQESSSRIGVGVALTPTTLTTNVGIGTSTVAVDFLIPIDLGESFRLEPCFRINQGTIENETKTTNNIFQGTSVSTVTSTTTLGGYNLGLGFFYKKMVGNSVQMNIGIRPTIILNSSEVESKSSTAVTTNGNTTTTNTPTSTEKQSSTFVNIAGVFGGEYFLGKQFSLGAE